MKRTLLWFGALIAVMIIAIWTFNYFTRGKIVINGGNGQQISLFKIGDASFSLKSTGSLRAKVKAGSYIVYVQGNSIAASQAVSVKAHQTVRYDLSPLVPKGVEPVSNDGASSLTVGSSLTYINSAANKINQIGSDGRVTVLDPNHQFQTIKWADKTYGLARDSSGNLYAIDGSKVAKLNTGLNLKDFSSVSISPSRQIFIAIKGDVYSSKGSVFSKLLSTGMTDPILYAGHEKLLIAESSDNPKSQGPNRLISLDTTTGQSVKNNLSVFSAAYSPDGRYLAVNGSSGNKILDSSLNPVANIAASNISNPVWLDNNTLFYSVRDQLWSYEVNHGRADLIANMPLGGVINELVLDDSKSYIYLTVGRNSKYEIKRVGLRGQVVPKFVYQLQSIMPLNAGQYRLSLNNFTSPEVIVSSNSDSPASAYIGEAKDLLVSRGFSLSNISIVPLDSLVGE